MDLSKHNIKPLTYPLGKKINIIGDGGKSTLAKCISSKFGYDLVELDALFWLPNWVESTPDDFNRKVSDAINDTSAAWVVDGNYFGKLNGYVSEKCDTVIWLELPWKVVFWRLLKRSILRIISKELICGDNRESLFSMLNSHHPIQDFFRKRKSYRSKGERLLSKIPRSVPIIRVTSKEELDFLYDLHGLRRNPYIY